MSVLIVVNNLNHGRYLPKSLESIREQNATVLGIDAGSTDDSLDAYERFRVPVIHCKGLNQPRSLNKVLSFTRADYFAWINADDAYLPNFLSSHLEAFADHPEADIVYSDWLQCDERTSDSDVPRKPRNLRESFERGRNPLVHPTTVIRWSLFDRIGLFDETISFPFDFEFWCRAWFRGIQFHYIPEPTAWWRIHLDSLSAKRGDAIREELGRIRKMYRGTPCTA